MHVMVDPWALGKVCAELQVRTCHGVAQQARRRGRTPAADPGPSPPLPARPPAELSAELPAELHAEPPAAPIAETPPPAEPLPSAMLAAMARRNCASSSAASVGS